MERLCHYDKPAKRGLSPKTHEPPEEGINQTSNQEAEDKPEELDSSTADIGVSVYRTTLSCLLHRAEFYGRVVRKKPLHIEKNKAACLEFTSRHIGDSPNTWKKVLWSDENKIELFGHQGSSGANLTPLSQCTAWWWQLWGYFSSAGTVTLVRIEAKMDDA